MYYLSYINLAIQLLFTFPTSVFLSNFSPNFPTSARTFQFQLELSTSALTFLFRLELSNLNLSNFISDFQTWTFQLLILSNCLFQLHVSQRNFYLKIPVYFPLVFWAKSLGKFDWTETRPKNFRLKWLFDDTRKSYCNENTRIR